MHAEGRGCRCGAGQRCLNAVNVDNLQVGAQIFYHREGMTELGVGSVSVKLHAEWKEHDILEEIKENPSRRTVMTQSKEINLSKVYYFTLLFKIKQVTTAFTGDLRMFYRSFRFSKLSVSVFILKGTSRIAPSVLTLQHRCIQLETRLSGSASQSRKATWEPPNFQSFL